MSKLPTRFVIAFLAIGILVGAATTATVMSVGLKPSNLAQAQIRLPTVSTGPSGVVASADSASAVSPNAAGGSGPKVSLTTIRVHSPDTTVQPGVSIAATATCPSGTVVTGGGFSPDLDTFPGLVLLHSDGPLGNTWELAVHNSDTVAHGFVVSATCASIH
jgi:hypothetical protein